MVQPLRESRVVEPRDRDWLDAELERFGIQRQARLERFEIGIVPMKFHALATYLPLIEVGRALDALEHAITLTGALPFPVFAADRLCDALLHIQNVSILEGGLAAPG